MSKYMVSLWFTSGDHAKATIEAPNAKIVLEKLYRVVSMDKFIYDRWAQEEGFVRAGGAEMTGTVQFVDIDKVKEEVNEVAV